MVAHSPEEHDIKGLPRQRNRCGSPFVGRCVSETGATAPLSADAPILCCMRTDTADVFQTVRVVHFAQSHTSVASPS